MFLQLVKLPKVNRVKVWWVKAVKVLKVKMFNLRWIYQIQAKNAKYVEFVDDVLVNRRNSSLILVEDDADHVAGHHASKKYPEH